MTAIHPHYFTIMLEGDDAQRFAIHANAWCAAHSLSDDDWTLRYRKTEFTNVAEPVYNFTISFADKGIAALWKLAWAGPALEGGSIRNPGV